MKIKDIHELEQSTMLMKDYLIPMLRSFYEACLENKFTKEQAFRLTLKQLEVISN